MHQPMDGGVRFLLEENKSLAAGTILASALVAGVIAYLIRRSRLERQYMAQPGALAERALEKAREAVGPERVEAVSSFIAERILPDLKPALLAMLRDMENLTQSYFRRAERAIKAL